MTSSSFLFRNSAQRNCERLHLNEAPYDWSAEAKGELLGRLGELPFNRYPERQEELSVRLGLRLGAPEGGLLLGPSSGALLDLVALAGISPGDEVAFPEPGFSLYPLLVGRHGGRVRPVPVGLGQPLEPWFEALDCRQLWLTSPNNPTGAWVDPEAFVPLLEAALQRPEPPLVVLDEAYVEFAPRTGRLLVDRYPNLLLLRTCSKALATAAWRLGYLLGAPARIRRLAELQLPYSIPAPSLEALDVALDFAKDFETRIDEVVERRDRLASAFPPGAEMRNKGFVVVGESVANFVGIEPDPSGVLEREGILTRQVPGCSWGRVTVGDEETTSDVARILGGSLPPRRRAQARRLLVLDIDGVMIDADRSFPEAVSRALGELRPGMPWSDAHFFAFKRIGGFNNDFRLAAAALALTEEDPRDLLSELVAAEGVGFPTLEGRIQILEPEAQAVVQRHYADTVALERPLVNLEELRSLGWDLAICTGRPPEELALAWKVLGFRLPAIADAAPHLRKPQPHGLLQLADAFRARTVLFAGDTRDDAAALARAREIRPDVEWTFAAIGKDRERIAAEGDLSAPTLRELLASGVRV